MPEVKLPEAGFSWDSVIYIIACLVALSGVLVALVKGWEAWKKISLRDRVKAIEGRLAKVEARLSLGDKRFDLQNDDMGHMLNTQMALLVHFVSGNDHDRLRDQLQDLTTYMSDRATRALEIANEHEQQNGGSHA